MVRIGGVVAAMAVALMAGRSWVVEAKDRTAAAGQRADVPAIQVYSRETVVDVTVLDKNGKPVHGLQQSDFAVEEDGKPEAIRSFAEYGTGAGTTAAAGMQRDKLPAQTYTNRDIPPAPDGAVNIIVLDAVQVTMMNQMRSRKAAAEFLRKMPAGTRVALFQLGNELKFVQGFTSDPDVLNAALMDMKNTVLEPGSMSGTPCMRNIVRSRLTIEAARQIAALVAGIKGKKNVLWFTGQYEIRPGPNCGPDAPGMDQALDLLGEKQVTVYAIDTLGVLELNAPQSAEFGATTPGAMQPSATVYGGLMINGIAGATGGGYLGGTNDIAGLMVTAIEEGSNYYSIAYVPAHGNDGFYHHIRVKLDRKGLELAYRPGYGADDIAKIEAETRIPTVLAAATPEPEKNTMTASMARFAPPATQVLFDVKVTPSSAAPGPGDAAMMGVPADGVKNKPMARYDLMYLLPPKEIAFAEGVDGSFRGSVEFDVVASDVFGKLITSRSQTLNLPLTVDEYGDFVKAPFQYLLQLDLPLGQAFVKVGIRDGVSKKVGTIEIPVVVK